MSRRDLIHDTVKKALQNDGWKITHDPLIIPSGGTTFRIDLGAEKIILAQKGIDKIAVEIKSMLKVALVYDFYETFGQYIFYRDAFDDEGIDREMYIAVSQQVWKRVQNVPFLLKRIEQYKLKIIVVDIKNRNVLEWIK